MTQDKSTPAKLYVDDWRSPPPGWELARTVEEAITVLKEKVFADVSLDFVIGTDPDTNFSPVARFIATLPEEKRPKRVFIHTSSPQGARTLRKILDGHVDVLP